MLFLRLEKSAPAEKFFHISYIWLHSDTQGFQGAELLEYHSSHPSSHLTQIFSMRSPKIFTLVDNVLELEWRQKYMVKKKHFGFLALQGALDAMVWYNSSDKAIFFKFYLVSSS